MSRLIGRVGVAVTKPYGSPYLSYSINVNVRASDGGLTFLRFSAQADEKSPDRAYALGIDNAIKLDQYDAHEQIKLLEKILKAFKKESAPRAYLGMDGNACMDQCSLARMLQACEKLGLHCSRFSNHSAAYNWSRDVNAEVSAVADAWVRDLNADAASVAS